MIYFYRVSVRKIHLPACLVPIDKYPFAEDSFGASACDGKRLSRMSRNTTCIKAPGNSCRIHFAKLARFYVDGWKSPARCIRWKIRRKMYGKSQNCHRFFHRGCLRNLRSSRSRTTLRSNARFLHGFCSATLEINFLISNYWKKKRKLRKNGNVLDLRRSAEGHIRDWQRGHPSRRYLNDSFAKRLR